MLDKQLLIFVLQEILHNAPTGSQHKNNENLKLFSDIQAVLPNHQGLFAPIMEGTWGLAMFIHKKYRIEETRDIWIHGSETSHVKGQPATIPRILQYTIISDQSSKKYTIGNVHGLWVKDNKIDTPERIEQSQKIFSSLKNVGTDIILGGDFNLRPETQSIGMLEKELELRNMIKEYKVTSTRTPLYTKNSETYADFIFTSESLSVKDFQVLPDVVSDHAALYIEI